MKNILEVLNYCLQNVTVHTTYKEYYCHISLTDDGNHKIYIRISESGDLEKTCVATPHRPENGTKFTKISLGGKCGLKHSLKAATEQPPFPT